MYGGAPNEVAVFDFERLGVYQRAVELLALAWRLAEGLPVHESALMEQLRRAALQVPLSIADDDLSVARASALQCAAILDVLRVLSLGQPRLLVQGRALLLRIVSMLSKLCRPG